MLITSVERRFELLKKRHPFPIVDGHVFDDVKDVYNYSQLENMACTWGKINKNSVVGVYMSGCQTATVALLYAANKYKIKLVLYFLKPRENHNKQYSKNHANYYEFPIWDKNSHPTTLGGFKPNLDSLVQQNQMDDDSLLEKEFLKNYTEKEPKEDFSNAIPSYAPVENKISLFEKLKNMLFKRKKRKIHNTNLFAKNYNSSDKVNILINSLELLFTNAKFITIELIPHKRSYTYVRHNNFFKSATNSTEIYKDFSQLAKKMGEYLLLVSDFKDVKITVV